MEKKKMTKKETINLLIDVLQGNQEVEDMQIFIDYLVNERNLLEKKLSKYSLSQTQLANEKIKEVIIETLLEIDKPVSITEIQKANEELGALSNQKISSLLTQLKNEGRVVRVEDKKKALFTIAR